MLPILFALAVIGLLFVIVIIGQPDEFKVCRSATISAPPERIFPHVNNLHKWEAWSPWAKLDPNAKNIHSGPEAGAGAAMRWEGNNKVGVGTMTITESTPEAAVCFRLDFEKPMQATNNAEFTLNSQGGQTAVTWSMTGKSNLMGKLFGLFMNCDKMIGCQFEKGLATLKSVVETEAK